MMKMFFVLITDGLILFEYHFFFCLDAKETKNQASIFLPQKSSKRFSYRDPSRSCFTLDSGVTPCGRRANPYCDFVAWQL
jgi:hypothetical protein